MQKDDATLVEAVLSGDREAYAEIVGRYGASLTAIALARTQNPDAARDIVQEAFTEGYARLGTLNNPDRLGAWLCGITVHKAVSWVRRRSREHPALLEHATTGTEAGPPEAAQRQEELQAVFAALDRLPEADREIILLRHVRGVGRQKAAGILDISAEAADKRLQRAMARIRSELGGES